MACLLRDRRRRLSAIQALPVVALGVFASNTWGEIQDYPQYASGSVDLIVPGTGNLYARDLEIEGSLAFVAASQGGLVIVDIADPSLPRQVGSIDTPGTVASVDVVGGLAYLADGQVSSLGNPRAGGLRIIDVSDPSQPVEVGFASTPGDAVDVEVRGNFAFVVDTVAGYNWPEALRVFDVSNPTAPVEIGRLFLPWHDNAGAYFQSIDVEGSLAVLITGGSASKLITVDVSDPSHPTQLGILNDVGGEDVDLVGTLAYVVGDFWWSKGFVTVDVSVPAAPVVVSRLAEFRAIDVDVAGAFAYSNHDDLTVLDVADPMQPREIGSLSIWSGPVPRDDVEVDDGHAYVLAGPGWGNTLSVRGFDPTASACSDNLDNDGDSAVDANDEGCSSPDDPSEYFDCGDGFDNDGDGAIDDEDPGCFSTLDRSEVFDCSDGIDNDADGPIDLQDFDCSDPQDPREQPACSDGIDNDGDGLLDHPDDPGCTDGADSTEQPDCGDGVDNDGDGTIDTGDPGCRDALSGLENPQCQDGLNNDGAPGIDFDGGASLHGGIPIDVADPHCTTPWRSKESRCGLGFELAFVLPVLAWLRRRVDQRPVPCRSQPRKVSQ